eukprot:6462553-Amphidinium_carterae.1
MMLEHSCSRFSETNPWLPLETNGRTQEQHVPFAANAKRIWSFPTEVCSVQEGKHPGMLTT